MRKKIKKKLSPLFLNLTNKKSGKNWKRKMNKYLKTIKQSILREEFIFQTTKKYESKSYGKTMIWQIQDIQDSKECLI